MMLNVERGQNHNSRNLGMEMLVTLLLLIFKTPRCVKKQLGNLAPEAHVHHGVDPIRTFQFVVRSVAMGKYVSIQEAGG